MDGWRTQPSGGKWLAAVSAGLLIAGLIPRLYGLTYHSLWLDEAISLSWARSPAWRILSVGFNLVQDKHPPLYYLLLHYWTHFWGTDDVALRGLSAWVGAFSVPLTYLLMRELTGEEAGVGAALLVAINPFLVWYGQEVRMFALAVTLLLAAAVCLIHALRIGGPWWVGFLVLATAAFYAYLFSALVILALGMTAFVAWATSERVRAQTVAMVLIFAVLGAVSAPLAWQAWRVGTGEAMRGVPFISAPGQVETLLRAFVMWKAPWNHTVSGALLVIFGLLAGWGLVAPLQKRKTSEILATSEVSTISQPPGAMWIPIYLLGPWLAANFLLLADRTVFDEARYLIFLCPAFCLALTRPLGSKWPAVRWSGRVATALALAVFLAALPFNWSPPARREEWRAAARYLDTHVGPQDIILVHADYAHKPLLHYYHGVAQVVYPFTGAIENVAQVEPLLKEMAQHPAVWVVRSHWEVPDPQGILDRWFADRYPLITEQYPAGIILKGYATGYHRPELPTGLVMANATFGDAIHLAGFAVDAGRVSAHDDLFHPPSGWIHVTLYWRASRPLSGAYEPELHLVDVSGQIWGDRLARANAAMRLYPPERWRPGEFVRDDYDVNLNPVTPPGRYALELRLKGPDGAPLPVIASGEVKDRLRLSEITVE